MTKTKAVITAEELKQALTQDRDFLKPLVQLVLQEVLEAEMEDTLGAGKGGRAEGRKGYRSGYYTRNLITRVGKLELRVPQDRQGRFSTEIFERYKALMLILYFVFPPRWPPEPVICFRKCSNPELVLKPRKKIL